MLADRSERSLTAADLDSGVTRALDRHADELAHGVIVLDYQYRAAEHFQRELPPAM
jgi:hypothetical protein